MYWANIHSFPGSCSLALAWMVCAREEQSLPEIRRPDSASIPRYAAGDLASSKCRPSYMKRTRTVCTVPARTWCTTGGSLGIGGAFYGVLCRQWRTNPIFAKREIWGRNISPPLLKGPKRRSRLPGRSVHHSRASQGTNRSPDALKCLVRSKAATGCRIGEWRSIHSGAGAVNRHGVVGWCATEIGYPYRIAGRS